MVKILGIADLLATALLLSRAFNSDIPLEMLLFILGILFFKALICLFDIGSLIDIGVVILLILSIFLNIHSLILFIASGFI